MDLQYLNFGPEASSISEQPLDENLSSGSATQLGNVWQTLGTETWMRMNGMTTADGVEIQREQMVQTRGERLNSESEESIAGFTQGWLAAEQPVEVSDIPDNKKTRRLEQNRAAQRAFREWKIQEVADLQRAVVGLEKGTAALETEKEQLKKELSDARKENEILKSILANACAMSASRDEAQTASAGHLSCSSRSFVVRVDVVAAETKDHGKVT